MGNAWLVLALVWATSALIVFGAVFMRGWRFGMRLPIVARAVRHDLKWRFRFIWTCMVGAMPHDAVTWSGYLFAPFMVMALLLGRAWSR